MSFAGDVYSSQDVRTKRYGVYFAEAPDLKIFMDRGESEDGVVVVDQHVYSSMPTAEKLAEAHSMRNSWSSEEDSLYEMQMGESSTSTRDSCDTSSSFFTSSNQGDSNSIMAATGCQPPHLTYSDSSSEDTLFDEDQAPALETRSRCHSQPKISIRQSIVHQLQLSVRPFPPSTCRVIQRFTNQSFSQTEEAFEEMNFCNASTSDPLVCPRHGCRETVRNVFALSRHLHLHDIQERHVPSPVSHSSPCSLILS